MVEKKVKCPGEAATTPNLMVVKKMFDSLKVDAHRFSLIYSWISNFIYHYTICHMVKQICPGVLNKALNEP